MLCVNLTNTNKFKLDDCNLLLLMVVTDLSGHALIPTRMPSLVHLKWQWFFAMFLVMVMKFTFLGMIGLHWNNQLGRNCYIPTTSVNPGKIKAEIYMYICAPLAVQCWICCELSLTEMRRSFWSVQSKVQLFNLSSLRDLEILDRLVAGTTMTDSLGRCRFIRVSV